MSKKLWFFVFLFFFVVAIAVLLAVDLTRPMVFATFASIALAISEGAASIGASAWWQMYGIYITAVGMLATGITLTALYYKGKIRMWQWGAKKAVEQAYGAKQPAPAPTPTPLATPVTAPTPVPVPEKKETAA